jgi:hypothetical protein
MRAIAGPLVILAAIRRRVKASGNLQFLIVLAAVAGLLAGVVATRLLLVGGDPYEKALESGKGNIPWVRDFMRLFPDTRNSFSYYTGQFGPPTWNSEVALYRRYVFTMQVQVTFDWSGTRVVGWGKPTFVLMESTTVTPLPTGQTEITYGAYLKFGEDEWRRVVEDGGSFSSLGIELIKDRPVPGFELQLPR